MNNNRNNNRRRGRGNRNQSGGGNQSNRIDSRARGNAPQMLDKYKKLAEDAHRNGDRVQAEYYLQFADHYFRVIADNRARQDEQRGDQRLGRRDEREHDDFETDEEDGGDFGGDDRRRYESREREDRGRDNRERDNREREPRRERPRRDFRQDEASDGVGTVEAAEGPAFEPEDNPFSRDTRTPRDRDPEGRSARRGARPPREPVVANGNGSEAPGIDAAVLPPSFSASDSVDDGESAEAAPRRRRKRSDGGTLSAVG